MAIAKKKASTSTAKKTKLAAPAKSRATSTRSTRSK